MLCGWRGRRVGFAKVCGVKRALQREYLDHVRIAVAHLASHREAPVALPSMLGVLGGYEHVRLNSVEAPRAQIAELMGRLTRSIDQTLVAGSCRER